ncbi:transglycosylase [Brevundimonas sp.]|uniref:transglycosylase n=1 Tax=Brevundimonas sp. TaxID=1871086 RepID=UPI003918F1BF
MQYLDIILAVAGALALGWVADLLTGGRGIARCLLASVTGAACGWFLAVRVFGVHAMGELGWTLWAMAGSVIVLLVYFLTRNKR